MNVRLNLLHMHLGLATIYIYQYIYYSILNIMQMENTENTKNSVPHTKRILSCVVRQKYFWISKLILFPEKKGKMICPVNIYIWNHFFICYTTRINYFDIMTTMAKCVYKKGLNKVTLIY